MKYKLAFLILFTAVVSFACAGTSQMVARQEPSQMPPKVSVKEAGGRSYKPITLQRTDSVAGGHCEAKLTFDKQGSGLISVETDTPGCAVTTKPLLVNGHEILDLSGSITFNGSCTTCYNTIYGPRCVTRYDRNC